MHFFYLYLLTTSMALHLSIELYALMFLLKMHLNSKNLQPRGDRLTLTYDFAEYNQSHYSSPHSKESMWRSNIFFICLWFLFQKIYKKKKSFPNDFVPLLPFCCVFLSIHDQKYDSIHIFSHSQFRRTWSLVELYGNTSLKNNVFLHPMSLIHT